MSKKVFQDAVSALFDLERIAVAMRAALEAGFVLQVFQQHAPAAPRSR